MHFGSGLGKRFGIGAEIKWNEKIPHRNEKIFQEINCNKSVPVPGTVPLSRDTASEGNKS